MFGVPFDDIAPIVDRSSEAARQLASRARRRVRGAAVPSEADLAAQWEVVDAFLAAARNGDFDALLAVLDPQVVLRADGGATGLSREVHGAETVAGQALMWSRVDLSMRRALINGAAGIVSTRGGQPFSVGAITVRDGKIVEIDILADPERLRRLDFSMLDD
jgi:RNA polymerase sigma-70 factor (ECF subfamily)